MTEGQSVYKAWSNQLHLMKGGAWLSRGAKFCTISSIGNIFLFHSTSTNNFYFISHLYQVNSVVKVYMHTLIIIFKKQYLQLVMPTCCSGDSWYCGIWALLLLWPLTQSMYFSRYLGFITPAVNSSVVMVTGFAPSSFSLAKSSFCWGYQVCDSKTIIYVTYIITFNAVQIINQ